MKNLRALLLVLLAFLLPVRGAMAAAMLCPGAGAQGVAVVAPEAVEPGHMKAHAADGLPASHAAMNHHASNADRSGEAAANPGEHQPGCQACANSCCVTPLAFAPPLVIAPHPITSVAFPALSVPVPAFQSGGQDRPPRTI
ncbi:MAG: hypothetical protein A3E25_12655 [Burkholderiales bacterium RIFCSPHIGHO2_12_FULL_69_20]|nr:MAG: hypothetical protein A3E25_12655 [Burkholderiales bacterium RIFCSPHIGHO2_12_FULL_69_20]